MGKRIYNPPHQHSNGLKCKSVRTLEGQMVGRSVIFSNHQLSHSFERSLSLFLVGCQGPHGRVKKMLMAESFYLVKGFSAQIAEIILCIPKTFLVIHRDEDDNSLGFMPNHLSTFIEETQNLLGWLTSAIMVSWWYFKSRPQKTLPARGSCQYCWWEASIPPAYSFTPFLAKQH